MGSKAKRATASPVKPATDWKPGDRVYWPGWRSEHTNGPKAGVVRFVECRDGKPFALHVEADSRGDQLTGDHESLYFDCELHDALTPYRTEAETWAAVLADAEREWQAASANLTRATLRRAKLYDALPKE